MGKRRRLATAQARRHKAVDMARVTSSSAAGVLMRLSIRLERIQAERLLALSEPLSVSQYRILDRVDRGRHGMTELALLARRSLPTISKSVDSLMAKGLLVGSPSAQDRRAIDLSLTKAGEEVLAEGRNAMRDIEKWVAAEIRATDAPILAETMERIYERAEPRLATPTTTRAAKTSSA
jgi:DNA-binding MarR family transcriptional regulator